ncbi:phosphocholine cytidylyltransferase family protein [Pacificimonas sp. ICDLI1SI03]
MIERAIILSAGQGSRLLPLTEDRPKCLIDFNGRTLLSWQLDMLIANGMKEIFVVTGFRADMIDAELTARTDPANVRIQTIFNPFYNVADNLGSVWLAREYMDRGFLLLNGDTLVSRELIALVLAAPSAPIRVTVDIKKQGYDSDDMRVELDGERLLDIGKRLPVERSHAESIGLLRFQDDGAKRFRDKVEEMMATDEGLRNWYLRVIHYLALDPKSPVFVTPIVGHEWGEVDFPRDVESGRSLTKSWIS